MGIKNNMKWAFFTIIIVFIVAVFSGQLGSTYPPQANTTPAVENTAALASARQYLKSMPFSYQGLITQLKFENFSAVAAQYAADNCGANWFEQAKRAAINYLNITKFSKSEIIEKLESDKFTHEQALYAANTLNLT